MRTPCADRRRLLRLGLGAGIAGAAAGAPWRAAAAVDPALLREFRRANLDWRAARGQTLVLGAVEHPWTEAITPMLPLFEELTGISVRVLKQSESDYVASIRSRLAARSPTPDALMVYALGPFIASGWLAPLEPLYANRNLFDPHWYDPADLFDAAGEIPRWTDDVRYSQSITIEVQMMFANGAMLAEAGLDAPRDFDALARAAQRLKTPRRSGISLRCKADGATMWPLAGLVFSNGGALVEQGRCVFDADAAAEAIELYVRLLRDAGPAPVQHDWYEVLRDFSEGGAALTLDSSNWCGDLANPQRTPVSADVLYAPLPGNGRLPAQPNVWAWQAGINAYSAHKEAAFLFLCFVNSPPGCRLSSAHGLGTQRPSAWASPAFRERFGARAADIAIASLTRAAAAKFKAAWLHPRYRLVLDALAQAVHACVNQGCELRRQLAAQAAEVNRRLKS